MALPRLHPRTWVLAIVLVLVGAEFGLRKAGFGQVAAAEADGVLGWRKQPNQDVPGTWGEGVHINGHGFRDADWAEPAAADQPVGAGGQAGLRVAILGDSVAYGSRLPREQGLARRLHQGLVPRTPGDLVVQNFSMPGWTLEQMVKAYDEVAAAWLPDVVVLVMGTAAIRPALPIQEPRDYPLRRSIERTALWDFIQRRLLRDPLAAVHAAEPAMDGLHVVEHAPLGDAAAPLWAAATEHLAQLERSVVGKGGRLCVVLVPRLQELTGESWRLVQAEGDPLGARWRGLAPEGSARLLLDCRRPLRRALWPLIESGAATGLVPRDLWGRNRTPAGEAIADVPSDPFLTADPLHLSSRGHALVAAEILLGLESAGWVQRPQTVADE